jgi:hypothetical protein
MRPELFEKRVRKVEERRGLGRMGSTVGADGVNA